MGEIKAKTHLEKLGFNDSDKKSPNHDAIQKWAYDNIADIIAKTVMKKNPHPYKLSKPIWEDQVVNRNRDFKQVIGFIDLWVEIEGTFYFSRDQEWHKHKTEVFIEVKTKIESLGALIRQMRAYQTFAPQEYRAFSEYIIVSPDDRHSETLIDQGFWFYKYNNPNELF
jgi:virulence-associated protein VapD